MLFTIISCTSIGTISVIVTHIKLSPVFSTRKWGTHSKSELASEYVLWSGILFQTYSLCILPYSESAVIFIHPFLVFITFKNVEISRSLMKVGFDQGLTSLRRWTKIYCCLLQLYKLWASVRGGKQTLAFYDMLFISIEYIKCRDHQHHRFVFIEGLLALLKLFILHLLLIEVIAHLFLHLFLLTTNKTDIKIGLLKCILSLPFSSLLPKGIAES